MIYSLTREQLIRLKKITDSKELAAYLQEMKQLPLSNPAIIKEYHDLLLYHSAFPFTKTIFRLAQEELKRVINAVHIIGKGKNIAKQKSLSGTGIAHTNLICSYSLPLVNWLVQKFPSSVELAGSDAGPEEIIGVFQLLLPAIEFENASQRELGLVARIRAAAGIQSPGAQLKWLLQLINDYPAEGSLKELLYQQLKLFVQWKLYDPAYSRSCIKIPVTATWYQTSFIKSVNSAALINERVHEIKLSVTERKVLADTVKASLAFYYRETDPFTYADAAEIHLFDMGRGLQIVLTGMLQNKRLSLESYAGYMALKNGVPIAYGGGWIWGHRCKIGLNIYPPFRKGESAWLFCQVLRIYHQYYRAGHFIVRPYQFGKANAEGIRSGAFWFYYKLGFRPAKPGLAQQAAKEWEKIHAGKHYRTPVKMLKAFTAADLEWLTGNPSYPSFGADELSAAISRQINQQYNGSRRAAIIMATDKMKQLFPATLVKQLDHVPEKIYESFLLLLNFIPDITQWHPQDKKKLAELFLLKARGKEKEYVLKLQQHLRLWQSLEFCLQQKHA